MGQIHIRIDDQTKADLQTALIIKGKSVTDFFHDCINQAVQQYNPDAHRKMIKLARACAVGDGGQLHLRLDDTLIKAIRLYAAEHRITVNQAVRDVLATHFKGGGKVEERVHNRPKACTQQTSF